MTSEVEVIVENILAAQVERIDESLAPGRMIGVGTRRMPYAVRFQ